MTENCHPEFGGDPGSIPKANRVETLVVMSAALATELEEGKTLELKLENCLALAALAAEMLSHPRPRSQCDMLCVSASSICDLMFCRTDSV